MSVFKNILMSVIIVCAMVAIAVFGSMLVDKYFPNWAKAAFLLLGFLCMVFLVYDFIAGNKKKDDDDESYEQKGE